MAQDNTSEHTFVAEFAKDSAAAFGEFVSTIARLRAPGGCPWDQKQTHESIARNMIEEAYEAVDAIEQKDVNHLREELGDVLLQVVLQSQIAADAHEFTIAEVCREVNEKMIRRHPHVFGDELCVQSADEVLTLWDKVKLSEKEAREQNDSARQTHEGLLDTVPTSFPALLQAYKISRKAVSAGFDWDSVDAVWRKVEEECAELKQAAQSGDTHAMELELGDVLFSLVNVARKYGIDAETSLRASCNKFRARWSFMEGVAWAQGSSIEELSMEELQILWDRAKRHFESESAGSKSGESESGEAEAEFESGAKSGGVEAESTEAAQAKQQVSE